MDDFDLVVYNSVLEGADRFMAGLGAPSTWKRSIRDQGGFYLGSFTLTGPAGTLIDLFYTWLGAHLIERSGGVITWEGMIYELELIHNGSRRRRSLDDMENAIDVAYSVDGEVSTLGFSTQAQAVARYGRRETLLTLDNVSQTVAQALQATYLGGHAWPWPRPVAVALEGETALTIQVAGYLLTASWLYAQAADGSTGNVEAWIEDLIGTAEGLSSDHGGSVSGAGDCQFLTAGTLGTNTLQVERRIDSDIRAWIQIEDLAALGDANGDPWRVWVDVGRQVHYKPIDLDPRYYIKAGGLYDAVASRARLNPWMVRPGVVRDLSYPITRADRGSMLGDARDLYVSEVEASADGTISLKPGQPADEAEIIAIQVEAGTPAAAVTQGMGSG